MLSAGALADPDPHTRLAIALVVADLPSSPEIAQALYRESAKPENFGDKWLGRAFYIAATRHQGEFLAAYKSDTAAVPFAALPVPLRMGNLKPDWRVPAAAEVASDWKDMQLPGAWETRGLPDFDGVVWFTRTIDWKGGAEAATLSFGQVRNNAEVWVNGLSVTLRAGGGRRAWRRPRRAAAATRFRRARCGRDRTRSPFGFRTAAAREDSSARRIRCSSKDLP